MGLLKGIPPAISPELLAALVRLGHGDKLVIADAHFPSVSVAKANNATLVRADGISGPTLLASILHLLNIDEYDSEPVNVMQVAPKDKGLVPPVWNTYKSILCNYNSKGNNNLYEVERFAFYERAKQAALVIQSGEMEKYANIILTVGLVTDTPKLFLGS